MSKFPPFSSRFNNNKKIERLYFPQYGDPNLFQECGRKHYFSKPSRILPFESNTNQRLQSKQSRQFNDQNHKQRLPSLQSQNRQQYNRNRYPQQIRNNYQMKGNFHSHRETLDLQVQNFNLQKIALNKHQEPFLKNRPQRMVTENVYKPYQQDTGFLLPSQAQMNKEKRQRMKTQSQMASSKSKPIRFNPTYLSSINY